MTPFLPQIKAKDIIRIAHRMGFVFDQQKGKNEEFLREALTSSGFLIEQLPVIASSKGSVKQRGSNLGKIEAGLRTPDGDVHLNSSNFLSFIPFFLTD